MTHNPPPVLLNVDTELERNVLGAALLSEPLPAFLAPEHFFYAHHQLVFRAVLALRKRRTDDMLARVGRLLHGKGKLWRPGPGQDRHSRPGQLTSFDLVEMTQEYVFAMRQGWAVDFERLRELAELRRLADVCERMAMRLRGGAVAIGEAKAELREAVA